MRNFYTVHSIKFFSFILLNSLIVSVAGAEVKRGILTPSSLNNTNTTQAVYDIDTDGQFDFNVEVLYTGNSIYSILFTGLNGTQFETDGNNNLFGYNHGAPLGNSSYRTAAYMQEFYFPIGVVRNISLRFKINGVSHCAYLGVSPRSYTTGIFDFYDYGYETNPNICIVANAVFSTSIPEEHHSPLAIVTPNPSKGNFEIALRQTYPTVSTSLRDITGRIIQTNSYTNIGRLKLCIEQGPGLYFLTIVADDRKDVIKLVKE